MWNPGFHVVISGSLIDRYMVNDDSFTPTSDQDKKYRNEDYINKILVGREQGELAEYKRIYNLSDEQIALFCDFAGLRDRTIKQMRIEQSARKQNNQKATPHELDMGAYIEQIEPQVRDAVMSLRHKGYTTYESGFGGFDSQKICFEEEHLKDYTAPQELVVELARAGAELIVKPRSLEIKFKEFRDLDQISEIWQKVVRKLPPLGSAAKPCNIVSARLFREKQSS